MEIRDFLSYLLEKYYSYLDIKDIEKIKSFINSETKEYKKGNFIFQKQGKKIFIFSKEEITLNFLEDINIELPEELIRSEKIVISTPLVPTTIYLKENERFLTVLNLFPNQITIKEGEMFLILEEKY